MKQKLKIYSIYSLLVVFFFVILVIWRQKELPLETQLAMQTKENTGEEFITLNIEKNSVEFYLDVSYLTNKSQTYNFYLLDNFSAIPFSLNGSEEKDAFEIELYKAGTPLSTGDNLIRIENLIRKNNDMCFLLVSSDFVFTKRFQVNYTYGSDNTILDSIKSTPFDESMTKKAAIFDGTIKLNIDYFMQSSRFYEQYKEESNSEINYIAIALQGTNILQENKPI